MTKARALQRFSLMVLAVLAIGLTAHQAQARGVLIPSPPSIDASSYILMDATTGTVITEGNADEKLSPASLTKLMTAYVAENEIDRGSISLEDEVPVSVKAWQTGGSRMFIKEGDTVKLDDLMHGIVIQSGNDASVAVAEHVAGDEGAFVDIMNQQAKLLGMRNTKFQSATGLPRANQYSTARDMAFLARHLINDFPEHYHLYSEKHFTYAGIRQPNRNKLLWQDDSVDGLKTGYTEDAGYCLVASAERGDTRLIAVVMGASGPKARAREVSKLLNYGFRYYETRTLIKAGEADPELKARVWKGLTDSVQMTVRDDINVTIPKGMETTRGDVVINDAPLSAPIQSGDELGSLTFSWENQQVKIRLVAEDAIESAGFMARLLDSIALLFRFLFG